MIENRVDETYVIRTPGFGIDKGAYNKYQLVIVIIFNIKLSYKARGTTVL